MASPIHQTRAGKRGVAALEYSLIVALIAVSVILGAGLLGKHLSREFRHIARHWLKSD